MITRQRFNYVAYATESQNKFSTLFYRNRAKAYFVFFLSAHNDAPKQVGWMHKISLAKQVSANTRRAERNSLLASSAVKPHSYLRWPGRSPSEPGALAVFNLFKASLS